MSQEKLAEFAEISVQMINGIEGCRTWVSDKTLVKLAKVLRVEVFQLFVPENSSKVNENNPVVSGILGNLRQNIKDDIDARFDRIETDA
jgi:transcriptional regulator with XRE-family HTH domain